MPYGAGPIMRQFEKVEIGRMMYSGVIEPANKECASLIVMVSKKYGSLRFCVEYRKLNTMGIRDSYSIPPMDECID